MQGLGILIVMAMFWACQRKVTTIIEEVSEPAAITEDQTVEIGCRAVPVPAARLSQTGCVNPKLASEPAEHLLPYDIIAPLWSDSSEKQRFLSVPAGQSARINADGQIELPVGSVTMKVFMLYGRPVETRLFMKESEGRWRGYSYEWRSDGSDADLLVEGKEKKIGMQTWVYPSRPLCDSCHNKAAESTLGLTTMQLGPRLALLAAAGVLDYDPATLGESPLVDYTDSSEPIEARARSYLQGNCAFCHQPHGGGVGDFDLRIQNDFAQIGFCNKDPLIDAFPVANGKIFKPGIPNESILLLRMKDPGDFHMPPRVSRVVDQMGVELMEKWIRVRRSCELPAFTSQP